LLVGQAFAEQVQQHALLVAESRQRTGVFRGPAELGHQRRRGPVVEQRSACADLFDGLGEFHALDVLDDVSAGAGEYCVQHRFVGGKRRQHQAAQVRQPGKEFSTQISAQECR